MCSFAGIALTLGFGSWTVKTFVWRGEPAMVEIYVSDLPRMLHCMTRKDRER